jgi:hypothetical protein
MDLQFPEAIKEIFSSIIDLALQNQMILLIQHPSDLFQINVSCYIEPDSIKLFIHVPMAPVDLLL